MKQTTTEHRQPQADETIKETFESIVIAFILAFVFRAYVVEAFVIPTGSMAPTLLGAHYRADCDQCGYRFKINFNPDASDKWSQGADCPMCRNDIDMEQNAAPLPGDRILVHKYIYTLSEPRRWDVVVFKAPHMPNTNFIKRLVGLPNESVRLLDGNVYTQPEGATNWNIARKSDKPKVQRAVWQPIYHSQYIPRDSGGFKGPGERSGANRWSTPWIAQSGDWDIDGRRSYEYKGGDAGQITFNFQPGSHFNLPSVYPYNQYDRSTFSDRIEDIRLAVSLQPQTDSNSVTLSTQTRLTGETQTVTATVNADGTITLTANDPLTGQPLELMTRKVAALKTGQTTPIEFWAVDQELSVWVNGKRVLRYLYADDLTSEQLINRPQPLRIPRISIKVSGGPATLHRVELDRDLYYDSSNRPRPEYFARGGMVRDAQGNVLANSIRPMRIHDNEFFCIGDNNPLSDDGRYWSPYPQTISYPPSASDHKYVNADALWVRQRYFDREVEDFSRDGIVPAKLMMGRAFFVYFPAPFSLNQSGMRIIPNFDDMRFIH